MNEAELQASLISELLEFNKKISILGVLPDSDEISRMKEIAKDIKSHKFDTSADDIAFIKEVNDFVNQFNAEY